MSLNIDTPEVRMRYLVAMIFAATFAAVTTVFLATPVASWIVDKLKFDSPDQVADLALRDLPWRQSPRYADRLDHRMGAGPRLLHQS